MTLVSRLAYITAFTSTRTLPAVKRRFSSLCQRSKAVFALGLSDLLARVTLTQGLLALIVLLLGLNFFQKAASPTLVSVTAPASATISETSRLAQAERAAKISDLSTSRSRLDALRLVRLQVVEEQKSVNQRFEAYLMNHKAAALTLGAVVGGANAAFDSAKSDEERVVGGILSIVGLAMGSDNSAEVTEVADQMAQQEARTKQYESRLADLDRQIRTAEAEVSRLESSL